MGILEEIVRLEKDALNKWANGDPAGYYIHAHSTISSYDENKAQDLMTGVARIREYSKGLEVPPHKYKMEQINVAHYGSTAILTYHYWPFDLKGNPLKRWRTTAVYILFENQWKMVHSNWASLKDADQNDLFK